MPVLGHREGKPPQLNQQKVDQNHADTRRDAGAHREYEKEQIAVAQPRLGAARIDCRSAGLFYPLGM
jgi:hypothetical protein